MIFNLTNRPPGEDLGVEVTQLSLKNRTIVANIYARLTLRRQGKGARGIWEALLDEYETVKQQTPELVIGKPKEVLISRLSVVTVELGRLATEAGWIVHYYPPKEK